MYLTAAAVRTLGSSTTDPEVRAACALVLREPVDPVPASLLDPVTGWPSVARARDVVVEALMGTR